MNKSQDTLFKSLLKGQRKDRLFLLQSIVKQVEKGTGQTLLELKELYSDEALFYTALKHITTTKKALCEALKIPLESACRRKRELEQKGLLVQSKEKFICPLTKHYAHLLSTNPKEFERLLKSNTKQLRLFE